MTALLVAGGVGLGAAANSLTSATVKAQPISHVYQPHVALASQIDQAEAGRNWARTAFNGGLRRCPAMNDGFLAACEAEMKALRAKPETAAGSYGGPLLVTRVAASPDADTRTDDRYAVIERPAGYHPTRYESAAATGEHNEERWPADAPPGVSEYGTFGSQR